MLTLTHPELKQATGLAFGVRGYGSASLGSERPDLHNPAQTQVPGTGIATDPCRIGAMVPASGLRW